jgi:LDH2 family malate/lactate/ureidoglycolate dehydrogenase
LPGQRRIEARARTEAQGIEVDNALMERFRFKKN